MQLKRRVALNGAELDQADSSIVIRSIEPADGRENISAVSLSGGSGQRVTGKHRDTVDMIVRFAILIRKNNLAGRATALEKANEWAAKAKNGAWLTVNYKTNRRLRVVLVQAPGEGSLWDYTKDFQITFRAYGVPYWQETSATASATVSAGTSGSGSLTVPGSAETVVDATLTNGSGSTVNTCSVTADGHTLSFSSLGLANGEKLVIDHTDDGLLRIRIQGTNSNYRDAMSKRTPSSADDLFCGTGTKTVSFTAEYACSMTASCKGRFL